MSLQRTRLLLTQLPTPILCRSSSQIYRSKYLTGNIELTELPLKHGADVNTRNSFGTSVLMYAALSNNTPLVKLLLKNGAKKNLIEKSGKTALNYAKMHESSELIALLAE